MKILIVLFCIVILSVIISVPSVSACSCAAEWDIQDDFAQEESIIFSGKVSSIKEQQRTFLVTFEVDQSWKGIPENIASINTMTFQSSATCGYNFVDDQSYLVVAHGKWDQTPEVSSCSSTTELAFAHEQISFLNKQLQSESEQKPLKLDDFAANLWYDHELIIDGTILDITGFGKEERTYDIRINDYFKPSEGKDFGVVTVYGFTPFSSSKGDRGIFFIKKDDAQWKHGQYGTKITEECMPELMYHNPPLTDPPLFRGQPQIDFNLLVDCYPYYYKKYLPQYMKAHGATEFPSPRTQAIDGVLPDEIVCNGNLELIAKRDGSPACVNHETKQKLIQRGWAKDNVISTFDYVIESNGVTYGSQYEITGGTVNQIKYDEHSNSLIISLSESENGYLQIVIQIGLLHSIDQSPFTYFVIVDGEEVMFEQLSPIYLKIPFEKGTKQIEIIGTNLI